MANDGEATKVNDEDLLADAIPIEDLEEIDEELVEESPASGSELTEEIEPIDIFEGDESTQEKKITSLATKQRHEDKWSRTPNATGQGAIHIKTFVSKLRLDAIEHMDQQVNEWLDDHPEYEVKLVSTSVGVLTGKMKEDALFMSVWV